MLLVALFAVADVILHTDVLLLLLLLLELGLLDSSKVEHLESALVGGLGNALRYLLRALLN